MNIDIQHFTLEELEVQAFLENETDLMHIFVVFQGIRDENKELKTTNEELVEDIEGLKIKISNLEDNLLVSQGATSELARQLVVVKQDLFSLLTKLEM